MNILVCVKHVVDTTEVRVDKKSGELVLRGIPTKINDYDKNAIEEAIKIKQAAGGSVTLLTIGPKDAFKTVKEGLAMGADKAYLIDEEGVNTDDPIEIARILASAVSKLGSFDLIFAGAVSEDKGNSLTGPSLAEWLDMEHIAYVNKLEVAGNGIIAERRVDQMMEKLEASLPVVITVDRSINSPRLPTAIQVMKVPASKIIKWDLNDAGTHADGTKPLSLTGYHVVSNQRKNILIEGNADAAVDRLVGYLEQEGVL